MTKFPGEIQRGRNGKMFFTDEQTAWFIKWYPVTENYRIAKAMGGISITKVRKFARSLNLEKSKEGLAAICKRQGKKMARTFERRGLYDAKRGKPCSKETMAGCMKRWEKIKAGLEKSPLEMFRESNPDKYSDFLRRKSAERKEMFRKERLRMVYGLQRKTKLKAVALCPYTRSQLHHRYNAIRRGYLLDVDCSEGTEGRYVIYYDDETERSERFERNCIKDGFSIKRDI